MKIGIMSMQRIYNYGSFLQAYALKSIIEEIGHEVEFVDYHVEPCLVDNSNNTSSLRRKIYKGISVIKMKASVLDKLRFIKFKRNYANRYYGFLGIDKNIMNYNPKLDVLLIGSDEVFNCVQDNTNVGYSKELFGNNNNAGKVISYAGSFGNTTIDKIDEYNIRDEIKAFLDKFDCISVRDYNSYNIISDLNIENVEMNVDPVLAFDWEDIIPSISMKCKYMVIYGYSGRFSDYECKMIEEYADRNKLKIICLGGIQNIRNSFIECSPFEVLAYFKQAECVITDTFHGSIFSIVNHKKFVTIIRESKACSYGNEEKLTNLLDLMRLSDRKMTELTDIEYILDKDIDYATIEDIIVKERTRTINYLKRAI